MIASYHPRGIDDDGGFDQDSLNSNHVDDDVNVTEDKVIKLNTHYQLLQECNNFIIVRKIITMILPTIMLISMLMMI